MALAAETLSTEEQAQLDQMRADDAVPVEPVGQPAAADPPIIVEPLTEEEQAATAAAAQAAQPTRQQMVPHAALHEERERRKEAERLIAEERKSRQTLEERTNLLLQRLGLAPQPQTPADPVIPALDQDPVGHIVGSVQQDRQAIQAIAQLMLQQDQQQKQAQSIQSLQARAQASEATFRQQTADYDAAVKHLAEVRGKQLEIEGFTDPMERQAILGRQALDVAQRAIQGGRNPAQTIYELAKTFGYAPPALAAAPAAEAAAAAPGDRIATLNRGQQETRTLGAVRGAGPQPLTAARLLEMTDAEFSKAIETPEGRAQLGA